MKEAYLDKDFLRYSHYSPSFRGQLYVAVKKNFNIFSHSILLVFLSFCSDVFYIITRKSMNYTIKT